MRYCAICLYPAPCGRDHGEDAEGNPVEATNYEPDALIWIDGEPISQRAIVDGWRCPHCQEDFLLQEGEAHIEKAHRDCLYCSADRLILAGILDWQARHPDEHNVS